MWIQVRQALDQSTARFLTALANALPGVIELIIALVVSVIVAWILAFVVRRLLAGMHFDERMNRWEFSSVAEWSPRHSPTLLISRTVAVLVVLSGLMIGVASFRTEMSYLFASTVLAYLPRIVAAILILVVGTLLARYLARTVLIGAVNLNLQHGRLLSVGVKWLVMVLSAAMALEHLRIAPGIVELAFGILFGGIVLALALAVGLGSKDLVSKSLEREKKESSEAIEEPLRHL